MDKNKTLWPRLPMLALNGSTELSIERLFNEPASIRELLQLLARLTDAAQQLYLLYFLQGKGQLSRLLDDHSQGKERDFNIEMIKVHLDNNNLAAIEHFTRLINDVSNSNAVAPEDMQSVQDLNKALAHLSPEQVMNQLYLLAGANVLMRISPPRNSSEFSHYQWLLEMLIDSHNHPSLKKDLNKLLGISEIAYEETYATADRDSETSSDVMSSVNGDLPAVEQSENESEYENIQKFLGNDLESLVAWLQQVERLSPVKRREKLLFHCQPGEQLNISCDGEELKGVFFNAASSPFIQIALITLLAYDQSAAIFLRKEWCINAQLKLLKKVYVHLEMSALEWSVLNNTLFHILSSEEEKEKKRELFSQLILLVAGNKTVEDVTKLLLANNFLTHLVSFVKGKKWDSRDLIDLRNILMDFCLEIKDVNFQFAFLVSSRLAVFGYTKYIDLNQLTGEAFHLIKDDDRLAEFLSSYLHSEIKRIKPVLQKSPQAVTRCIAVLDKIGGIAIPVLEIFLDGMDASMIAKHLYKAEYDKPNDDGLVSFIREKIRYADFHKFAWHAHNKAAYTYWSRLGADFLLQYVSREEQLDCIIAVMTSLYIFSSGSIRMIHPSMYLVGLYYLYLNPKCEDIKKNILSAMGKNEDCKNHSILACWVRDPHNQTLWECKQALNDYQKNKNTQNRSDAQRTRDCLLVDIQNITQDINGKALSLDANACVQLLKSVYDKIDAVQKSYVSEKTSYFSSKNTTLDLLQKIFLAVKNVYVVNDIEKDARILQAFMQTIIKPSVSNDHSSPSASAPPLPDELIVEAVAVATPVAEARIVDDENSERYVTSVKATVFSKKPDTESASPSSSSTPEFGNE